MAHNNGIDDQHDGSNLPRPTWAPLPRRSWRGMLRPASEKFWGLTLRYLVFRGDPVAYLRHCGARIGDHCQILTHVKNFGSEPWLIAIGNRVTLANGVVLLTHDGASRVFRHTVPASSPWGNRFGRIVVGNNCFIGVNAIIMPDVSIGANCIVGAGSVVVSDVSPRSVVAGVPARQIATLDEYIARYRSKMIPLTATSRRALRHELTTHFWGESR